MAQRPLIGTSPNQVSTNGMLGDLAFQDSTGTYIETIRGAVNLDKLDKEITDTAVDIFVYDTRKDSDGGAWRKRTQHTSWYNETLNTATRGSRKEFPAVAVIVVELGNNGDTALTVYDGDDPDLPMWMVFISNSGSYLQATCNAVHALNGEIVVGRSGAVRKWNYIDENAFSITISNTSKNNGNLSQRNSQSGWYQVSTNTIVAAPINDVAMTVLPNAPIDSATGLPIPTIAVATDGGVSVIKDDGTVVDDTDTSAFGSVDFNDEYRIISTRKETGSQRARFFVSKKIDTVSSDSAWLYEYYTGNFSSGYPRLRLEDTGAGITLGLKGDTSVRGSNIGFTLWDVNSSQIGPNEYSTNSLMCGISTSYNTGWMHGDIKGAFLSDTDATNVSASTNLVTNGTFDSDNSSWDGTGISLYHNTFTTSQSSGYLIVNSNTNSSSTYGVSQDVTTTTGTEYMLSFDIVSGGTGDGAVRVADGNTATNPLTTVSGLGVGSHSFRFTSGSQSFSKVFLGRDASTNGGTNRTVYYDNIVVREATEADRSVNNKGLQVFGTITKSAVATGADLVAYSGWGTSNYLEQPYNSDFNLTLTQDASWIIWFKNTESIETYYHFFDSGYVLDSAQHYWLIGILGTGDGRPTFRLNGASQQNLNGVGNYLDGLWHQVVVTRSGGGKLISMYIDGKLSSALSSSSLEITHSSDAKLRVGLRGGTNNRPNTGGYLTQLRFSRSAPTPEQIRKIYEDEKVLFQENAKCTLYGSSDAVTALAYDEDYETLYVGTSSGRSDFRGLRRINNTTTAVTTAISASNGLVAEQ